MSDYTSHFPSLLVLYCPGPHHSPSFLRDLSFQSLLPPYCSCDNSWTSSPVTFDPISETPPHSSIIWDFVCLKIKLISPTLWLIIFFIYFSNKVYLFVAIPSEYIQDLTVLPHWSKPLTFLNHNCHSFPNWSPLFLLLPPAQPSPLLLLPPSLFQGTNPWSSCQALLTSPPWSPAQFRVQAGKSVGRVPLPGPPPLSRLPLASFPLLQCPAPLVHVAQPITFLGLSTNITLFVKLSLTTGM